MNIWGSDKWFVGPNLISGIAGRTACSRLTNYGQTGPDYTISISIYALRFSDKKFWNVITFHKVNFKRVVEYINIQSQNIVIGASSFTLFIDDSVALR